MTEYLGSGAITLSTAEQSVRSVAESEIVTLLCRGRKQYSTQTEDIYLLGEFNCIHLLPKHPLNL